MAKILTEEMRQKAYANINERKAHAAADRAFLDEMEAELAKPGSTQYATVEKLFEALLGHDWKKIIEDNPVSSEE